jgi:hypothetical protein
MVERGEQGVHAQRLLDEVEEMQMAVDHRVPGCGYEAVAPFGRGCARSDG